MKYDYLVVGAGLFGAIFAYEAKKLASNKDALLEVVRNAGKTLAEK